MVAVLFVLFLVMPVVELYVIIQVAQAVGTLETIALMIMVGAVGAWLCKREGLGVLRRLNEQLARGSLPTGELVDGFLILLAGALMLTPGFVTDVLGLGLLLPPTRTGVRALLLRRFRRRIESSADGGGVSFRFVRFGAGATATSRFGSDFIDADSDEVPVPSHPRSWPSTHELGGG